MTESHAHYEGIRVKRAGGAALVQVTVQHIHRLSSRASVDEIQTAQRLGPLREVRMAVPQAGDDPQAIRIDGGFVSRCGGWRWSRGAAGVSGVRRVRRECRMRSSRHCAMRG